MRSSRTILLASRRIQSFEEVIEIAEGVVSEQLDWTLLSALLHEAVNARTVAIMSPAQPQFLEPEGDVVITSVDLEEVSEKDEATGTYFLDLIVLAMPQFDTDWIGRTAMAIPTGGRDPASPV